MSKEEFDEECKALSGIIRLEEERDFFRRSRREVDSRR
jgi:hypothetical protein